MKKIFAMLTLVIVATTFTNAEKVRTYTMKLPSFVFEGVKTVYIKDIPVEDGELWNRGTGMEVKKILKENIQNGRIGEKAGHKLCTPWMSTQFYQLVNSEAEADLVISGSIRSSLRKNEEVGLKGKYNTETHKLPFFVKKYSKNKDAEAAIDLQFTNKNGVAVKSYSKMNMTYHYSKEYLGAPKLTKDGNYEGEIRDYDITMKCIAPYLNTIVAEITPRLLSKTYDVKKVKKIKDKELKKTNKSANKLLRKGSYAEAADIFAEVAANASDSRSVATANKDAGILYMVTGNFEKAEEFLTKTNDSALLNDLKKRKELYNELKRIGIL